MSSSSRPQGRHVAPRRGGRVLTGRRIRVEGARRAEIDVHYLGRALLRLAQEHYDADHAEPDTPAPEPGTRAPVRPHVPDTGAKGAPPGAGPTSRRAAPPARPERATG